MEDDVHFETGNCPGNAPAGSSFVTLQEGLDDLEPPRGKRDKEGFLSSSGCHIRGGELMTAGCIDYIVSIVAESNDARAGVLA